MRIVRVEAVAHAENGEMYQAATDVDVSLSGGDQLEVKFVWKVNETGPAIVNLKTASPPRNWTEPPAPSLATEMFLRERRRLP